MTTTSYSLRLATKSTTSCGTFTSALSSFIAAVDAFAKRHDLALILDDPYAWLIQTAFIRTLAEMYSGLLEEKVTPRFTLHFVMAQVAAFFTIMPADMNIIIRLVCLAWLLLSTISTIRAYGEPEA